MFSSLILIIARLIFLGKISLQRDPTPSGGGELRVANLDVIVGESESNMMRNVDNSVETVNAAATAIVNAESRVQPSSVQVPRAFFLPMLNCITDSVSDG